MNCQKQDQRLYHHKYPMGNQKPALWTITTLPGQKWAGFLWYNQGYHEIWPLFPTLQLLSLANETCHYKTMSDVTEKNVSSGITPLNSEEP